VNNTYYLLRAKPHVLSYFHTPWWCSCCWYILKS
jgi:hypothetical protein